MITPELVAKAIETSHDNCVDGCIHADSISANTKTLRVLIEELVRIAAINRFDPADFIATSFIHIGYKLHQLEVEAQSNPTPKEKVN